MISDIIVEERQLKYSRKRFNAAVELHRDSLTYNDTIIDGVKSLYWKKDFGRLEEFRVLLDSAPTNYVNQQIEIFFLKFSFQGYLIKKFRFKLVETDDANNKYLVYTEKGNDVLLKMIQESDIVMDIGGHLGAFTIAAAQLGYYVHTYEPNKKLFHILNINVRNSGLHNMRLNAVGLSDKDETATLLTDPRRSMNSSVYHKQTLNGDPVSIELIDAFTAFTNVRPTIVKMDCEGSEYPIIIAYGHLFATWGITAIYVEFHLDNVGVSGAHGGKREDTAKYQQYIDIMSVDYKIAWQDYRDVVQYEEDGVQKSQLKRGVNERIWVLK